MSSKAGAVNRGHILRASELDGHTYLQENRPGWVKTIGQILDMGGAWGCWNCETGVSHLPYRCSMCGADLLR